MTPNQVIVVGARRGQPVASGVYFYKLEAGAYTKTRKMVLLK